MRIHDTESERQLRLDILEFLRTACAPSTRRKVRLGHKLTRDEMVTWQRTLNARGWAVPHWPREWGGTEWNPIELNIMAEAIYQADVPEPLAQNTKMVGPVIARFGTEAQKRRFLPAIANLDLWFCQGFSEPGAGSDLASLRTRAVRDGEHYLVNGQKTWTSGAQNADWIFCLVRSNPKAKAQQGISFLLIDLASPGVTVRPIRSIDGIAELNEVFFDEVRVPADQLIGEEDRGWEYAKFLLVHERTNVARIGLSRQRLRRAITIAAEAGDTRGSLGFAQRAALAEAHIKALEITQLRMLNAPARNNDEAAVMSSILKIRGSELQQATAELMLEAAGQDGLIDLRAVVEDHAIPPSDVPAWAASVPATYFFARAASIYGGANEIQRNIIAKALIG
ncbi:MAG: acyl-CoA dehydrogenase family protein [Ottowia sp.]|uniref:acyl-CoA dehydrogenase family protein n=1 Tax=Ottowia sp. TaxID=1898956 RepID=UPI003C780620